MENSGIFDPLTNEEFKYFFSINSKRPESSEECQKLEREAAEFFKNYEKNFKNFFDKFKARGPESLEPGELFSMHFALDKFEKIQDIYMSSMKNLNRIEELLKDEEIIKTDALNRLYKKDEKP